MKQKLVSPRVDPLPGTTVNATGSEKHRRVGTFFWILGEEGLRCWRNCAIG